mmetsp:Transcript_2951/g.6309  ORF Transcript_2951/g.6309 Transcript_2951/m.6309 type:complete len:115 (+) Transcript_2951:403-747(+)
MPSSWPPRHSLQAGGDRWEAGLVESTHGRTQGKQRAACMCVSHTSTTHTREAAATSATEAAATTRRGPGSTRVWVVGMTISAQPQVCAGSSLAKWIYLPDPSIEFEIQVSTVIR